MVSTRLLNVSLVVSCVVVVALLCTALAVQSGDVALKDTQLSRDKSVKTISAGGDAAVDKVVKDLLATHVSSTRRGFVAFYSVAQKITEKLCNQIMSEKDETDITFWEYLYSWRRSLFHTINAYSEIDAIGTHIWRIVVRYSELPNRFPPTTVQGLKSLVATAMGVSEEGLEIKYAHAQSGDTATLRTEECVRRLSDGDVVALFNPKQEALTELEARGCGNGPADFVAAVKSNDNALCELYMRAARAYAITNAASLARNQEDAPKLLLENKSLDSDVRPRTTH